MRVRVRVGVTVSARIRARVRVRVSGQGQGRHLMSSQHSSSVAPRAEACCFSACGPLRSRESAKGM